MEHINSGDKITWWVIENTVTSRLVNNSLLHDLSMSKKIRRRTDALNCKLKRFSNLKNYKHYVKVKSMVWKKILNDSETDDEPCLSDDDYQKIYKRNSPQQSLKDCNTMTENSTVSVSAASEAKNIKLDSKENKNNKKFILSKSCEFRKSNTNDNNEQDSRKNESTLHNSECYNIISDSSEVSTLDVNDSVNDQENAVDLIFSDKKNNGKLCSRMQYHDGIQNNNVWISTQIAIEKRDDPSKIKHIRTNNESYLDNSLQLFHTKPLTQSTRIYDDTDDITDKNIYVEENFLKEILNGDPMNQPKNLDIEEDDHESFSKNDRRKRQRTAIIKKDLLRIHSVPLYIIMNEVDNSENESAVLKYYNSSSSNESLEGVRTSIIVNQSCLEIDKTFRNHGLQSDNENRFSKVNEMLNEDLKEMENASVPKSFSIEEFVLDQEIQKNRLPLTITRSEIVNTKHKIIKKEQEDDEDALEDECAERYNILRLSAEEENCNENKEGNIIIPYVIRQLQQLKGINLARGSDSSMPDKEIDCKIKNVKDNNCTENKVEKYESNNLQLAEVKYSTESEESPETDHRKLLNTDNDSSDEELTGENDKIKKSGNYLKGNKFDSTIGFVHKHISVDSNFSNKDRAKNSRIITNKIKGHKSINEHNTIIPQTLIKTRNNSDKRHDFSDKDCSAEQQISDCSSFLNTKKNQNEKTMLQNKETNNQDFVIKLNDSRIIQSSKEFIDVSSLHTILVNNGNDVYSSRSSYSIKKNKSNGIDMAVIPTESESLSDVLKTLYAKNKQGLHGNENSQNQRLLENIENMESQNIEVEYSRPRKLKDLIEKECLIPESAKATFTLNDLSNDDEIWILDIPKTISLLHLQGETLAIGKSTLKIGEKYYEIIRRKNNKLSCIFRTSKKNKRCKIVNIEPAISVLLRQNRSHT